MGQTIRVRVEGPDWLTYDPGTGTVTIKSEGGVPFEIVRAASGIHVSVARPYGMSVLPMTCRTVAVEHQGLPL